MLVLYFNIFTIVAAVPTGLQTCAKVLQMHLPGGGGTTWLKSKSDITFIIGLFFLFEFLAAGVVF